MLETNVTQTLKNVEIRIVHRQADGRFFYSRSEDGYDVVSGRPITRDRAQEIYDAHKESNRQIATGTPFANGDWGWSVWVWEMCDDE